MAQINEVSAKSRKNILAKLKSEVAGADYGKLPAEPTFDYQQMSEQQSIEHFIQCLTNNHAEVIKVATESVANVIEEQLQKRQIDKLLYGENGQYSENLETYFSQNKSDIKLEKYDFLLSENKSKLFDHAPASFTSSKCAIAATGTIVLWPTVEEPRTLSLVPPVHFVLVDAKNMVKDFATLIKVQQWKDAMPTNVLLISGPSKTADIQQTLAYGAHGPKELIVLLLNA